jgi:hypothetical protein
VKMVRDEVARMTAMLSATPYALNASSVEKLFKSPPEEVSAFAIGLAKNAQQANRYNPGLYGLVLNYLNDKVLAQSEVHPSDDIKLRLGLTEANVGVSFMEL